MIVGDVVFLSPQTAILHRTFSIAKIARITQPRSKSIALFTWT